MSATVTVTSLGDRGCEAVWPVINPPQVAIVGFGVIGARGHQRTTHGIGVRGLSVVDEDRSAPTSPWYRHDGNPGVGCSGDCRPCTGTSDDLIVTGTTLVRAAEACRKRGAIAVHAMATHGMFTKATGGVLATPLIDSIIVTDTVSPERIDMGASRAKLSIVSIAPLLARAISALHHERSMTQMMED
jgi:hypothetical protein